MPEKSAHTKLDKHIHKFPRVVVEGSIKLSDTNPFQEFVIGLQNLLKNGQLVDPFFEFCPINTGGLEKKIHELSGIPINMTMLGTHFKISSNGRNPFERQKVWGKGANKNKEEFWDPVVYFTFAFATDTAPKDLISQVVHEWHRIGGVRLEIKELQTFESETILSLFNIFTSTNKKILLAELQEILTEAQSQVQEQDATEFWWSSEDTGPKSTLPAFELRLINQKLPGQDTSHFNKLSWWVQVNRKVYHVECDRRFSKDIQRLMHYAKELDLVTKYWGCHAHVDKVMDKSSSPSEIKCLIQVTQCHSSYQCSMILEDILGIVDLDGSAVVKDEETGREIMSITLRSFLFKYLRLSDGHQLIAEIHQSSEPMPPIQAVVPNTHEAECMIVMMNKNFLAYVGNVLRDQGLPEDFLMELFRGSCCQTMISEIQSTSWDSETGSLTTAKELAQDKTITGLKKAAWFKDAFSDLNLNQSSKGTKQPAPPPEALFHLDGEWSIQTIHERHMH